MAHTKQVTAIIKTSSWRNQASTSLNGTVTHGPANTVGRNVEFIVPNDDVEYAVRALAMWASRPWDSQVYSTSFEQDKLSATWLRKLADSMDPQ